MEQVRLAQGSNLTISEANSSGIIGVQVGDQFTYVVDRQEEYLEENGQRTYSEFGMRIVYYENNGNHTSAYAVEGDEYTITITNYSVTPQSESQHLIAIKADLNDQTHNLNISTVNFEIGTFDFGFSIDRWILVTLEWAANSQNQDNFFEWQNQFFSQYNGKYKSEKIDTTTEFGLKIKISFSGDGIGELEYDIMYDKSTGMQLYYHTREYEAEENTQYLNEVIIKQLGYEYGYDYDLGSGEDKEGILNSYTLMGIIISFAFPVIIPRLRKNPNL